MESYQTLNRELVLTVRDLRKENFDLRDLVNSLKSENMTITSEFSDFKRRALDKFMKFSEIIGSVGADLFGETPKTAIQQEMTKMRYSMGMNSSGAGSLPRSSPEKMPRKPGSFHVNVGRRRGGQKPREVGTSDEETDLQDMSIENIQEWLRTDQIEISVPIREDHEEAQPTGDTSQIQEEATQVPEERPQEVPENVDGLYKNMTTILEENSKSISQNSLLQVAKFASSTPHNNNKPFPESVRMDVSPIEFRKCDQRCLQTNFERMDRIFERKSPKVSEGHSLSPMMPKNVAIRRRERVVRESTPEKPEEAPKEPEMASEEPKNVAIRKRGRVIRDSTPEKSEMTPKVAGKTPKEPKETPKEPEETPEEPNNVAIRKRGRVIRDSTPEKPEETPKALGKTPKGPEMTPEKPEMASEEPKNVAIRRRERVVRESTPEKPKEPEEPPEEPQKAKKNAGRKKLADKTNLTENATVEPPKPIKVENLDEIVECRRPKRRAAPQNLMEPSLSIKMRRN